MRPFLLPAIAIVVLTALPAKAQVIPVYGVLYRPPGVRYEVLRSRHFDVIHQRGTRDRAAELAAVLEDALPAAASMLPVRDDFRMPVVLNRYTDRGNGYVSPIAFRQEIEAIPFHSRVLSPRHASWFETVAPHELLHAVHADYSAGFGAGGLVRVFAPDMARAMNLWVPPGLAEGAAIYLESRRGEHAGRMNYGYYAMQFRAAVGSGNAWSLAQSLEVPAYSRPTDRYYIGGGHFFDWTMKEYGPDAFRRVTRIHNRFPFLGYGVSLWIATGEFPLTTGRSFRRDAARTERARQAAIDPVRREPLLSEEGTLYRRPRWLDDGTLAVFATGYSLTRGLYAVDVATGEQRVVAHEEVTNDLQFAVDGDRLLYARYLADAFSPVQYTADLFALARSTGRPERITRGARLIYPAPHPDGGILAVETSGRGGSIVRVQPDGTLTPFFSDADLQIVGLDVDPESGRIAVVANRYGTQALYLLEDGDLRRVVAFRTGSVLDAAWAPGSDWIVLSADPDARLDVFAHDTAGGKTVRITRARYGAMEPEVSPDGTRIAYVNYADARFELVVDDFDPASAPVVAPDLLRTGAPVDAPALTVPSNTVWIDTTAVPYRAVANVRPRMLYPTLYYEDSPGGGFDADLGIGGGLAIQGADPLLTWAYWGEAVYQKGRMWGEIGVRTADVVLRPVARLYSRPEVVTARFIDRDGSSMDRRVIREERGGQIAVGVPVTLSNNVYASSLSVGAGLQYEQERLYDDTMRPLTDYIGRVTATGSFSAGLGLQRNLRDLVPNSGLAFGVSAESDLDADGGPERRAVAATSAFYLPWLKRWNVGLNLNAGVVSQTDPTVFDLDTFMPRGYEDRLPSLGTVARVGAETTIPVMFVDDGLFVLPIYLASVYVYGFGETVFDTDPLTSVGGGLGLQLRLFYVVGLDLRFGVARRLAEGDWQAIYR